MNDYSFFNHESHGVGNGVTLFIGQESNSVTYSV